ncbi:hypothetical protein G5V58_24145 [Nocardioides anomalus]|uniref:Uncharacterized protein n=1 Tax=Nocardioides anomalus TaxID=2712223 RepID=A0A6G6W814_9ACTN|nr:hypothetical protein [Nocardioides anomalus]QIG41364.1 hypothetical protein G5V58_24145 [Nocardioides anomalus]
MQIIVNGQSYTRWEDVPEAVRTQLAATLPDTDHNGVPDMLEGNLSGLSQLAGQAQTFTSVSVDGQPVSSLGQLPPEVQELLQKTLGLAQPGSVAAPPPAPGAAPAAPATPATGTPAPPLQPGQVMLNGVPTTPGDITEPRKPWWKRLFGG